MGGGWLRMPVHKLVNWLMTFIYDLDPYSLEMYRRSENELPMSRFSKDRLTDRSQTDGNENIYDAATRVNDEKETGIQYNLHLKFQILAIYLFFRFAV